MRRALAVVFVAVLGSVSKASAQWNPARTDTAKTSVYTTYGIDPAFVGSLGLARRTSWLGNMQFGIEGGIATSKFDVRDFRARVSGRSTMWQWGAVRVVGEESIIARGTSNNIYDAFGFGFAGTYTVGVFRPSWFVGAETGYDRDVATRITNLDWYRTWFYPAAKDGWYVNTSGTLHFGLSAGKSFGHLELMSRAGIQRTEHFGEMNPPFYVAVGLGLR